MDNYLKIMALLEKEYSDYFVQITISRQRSSGGSFKLRGILKDGSFLDIYLSREGKYSYHWERRGVDGKIYRWDNAPDHKEIESFPKHFHRELENKVESSPLSDNPTEAIRGIMKFIKEIIK